MKSSETPITDTAKYGEKLNYDPEFRGPVKSRSCTDIICLFLFVAFLAGWAVVGFFAYREGDPRILLYPTDSEGNICGVGKLEDRKYLFFFDLMKCASPSVILNGCPTPQVCVKQCPRETFFAGAPSMIDSKEIKDKLICKYNVSKESKSVSALLEDEDCAKLYLKSTAIIGRCVPDVFVSDEVNQVVKDVQNKTLNDGTRDISVEAVKNATRTLAKFLSFREIGEKIFSDFKSSWYYIVLGLVLSMLISLVWIVLMRWIAGIMIWLSIFIVLGFSAYACYYSTTKYIALEKIPESNRKFRLTFDVKSYLTLRDTWLAFAIISGVVFGILFLVILFLRKRIFIAIALIKEASRAVSYMATALLFPIIPYLLMAVFFVVWFLIALYIASSGKASFVVVNAPNGSPLRNGSSCDPQNFTKSLNATGEGIKCLFKSYGLKDNILSAHAYNLFGLFWGLFFAVGVGQVSLAGAFASYYWTLEKKNVPTFAVATGLYRCVRFHLGSVILGSLLIALVRFIRVVMEYIDKQTKKYDNQFIRILKWCLKCCFWCMENILKFISKNAYIMIAIYGKNFCTSAKRAFMLLMRNILRVVVLDKITDFLLFLGKLVVVAFSACISFYIFATDQKVFKNLPVLNYKLIPPILITSGSYIIASAFFSVYGMAVDTLFLCFLEDCERNDGSAEKPYFMSKELMKILDKRNKYREPQSPQRSPH